MLVSEFLEHVNYALRATDDVAPSIDSEEGVYWIATANRKKNELYGDITKRWSAGFATLDLGEISAGAAPSFNLSSEFLTQAGEPYVIQTNGHRKTLDLVKPYEQNHYLQQVYISGASPQVLTFTQEIDTDDNLVGGTLYLPGYFMPADMTTNTGTVPVDDPYYLVMATASEIAFGDLTYEDKAADLNAKAAALYSQMIKRNMHRGYGNPNVTAYQVPKLRGPERM